MLDVTGTSDRNACFVLTFELTLDASATYQLNVRDAANEKRRSDKGRPCVFCVCEQRTSKKQKKQQPWGDTLREEKDERQMRDVDNK